MELKKTSDYKGLSIEATYLSLETGGDGLSEAEANQRIKVFGQNRITETHRSPVLEFLARFWGPMPWLLELTIILSIFLKHILEAAIIFFLLSINAGIGYWNERNSHKALELLKRKLTVQVNVKRSGKWESRPSSDLVPGDVINIGLGEIVSADLKLTGGEVAMDQSALTGESLPVTLKPSGIAYSGSIVKRGEAQGVVLNTGANTYFGKTAELVKTAKSVSHQEQIMLKVVQYMLLLSFAAILIVILDALWFKISLLSILSISLIFLMGAVPVALPAVFTTVLATGALQLSRQSVLVTRLSAIEDAASMTVLCLDKTGTITQNKLSVAPPLPWENINPEDVAAAADMASSSQNKDVIDLAVKEYAQTKTNTRKYKQLSFTPFDPTSKRSEARVEENGKQYRVIKGAAQIVISLCNDLDASQKIEIDKQVQGLSEKGFRVLAVARSDEADLDRIHFLGLLPLADPPRPDSRNMIEEMQRLGVKVKMLTGDNLAIAREIAGQVAVGDKIIRISELNGLSESEQAEVLEKNDGIAEIYPEDKYRIVKLLQSRGYIVGMTGDGVNDAPALKQAEVGIAVESAADVSKAAASIVLTEPGLHAIDLAIKTSRRIYQRMLSWVINKVTKVVQFVVFLLAGFLIWHEVLLSPLDMVLLIFANDFITMSLATDNVTSTASPNIWNVKKITIVSLILGLLLMFKSLLMSIIDRAWFHPAPPSRQTLALLSLVFTSLFRILIVRERRHFWSSWPGKALQASVYSTMIAFFLLGVFGLIIPSVPVGQVAIVYLFSAVYVLALDFPKYAIFRKYGF